MFTFCSVFLTRVARENTYNFVCFENEIPVERSLQCQALSFLTLLSQSVSGLAYCSNQKWQRMWKPRSFQPLVLVLCTGLVHTVAAGSNTSGVLETSSPATLESL